MDPRQLREYVIRPTLKDNGLWSPGAEQLLFVTAGVESALGYHLVQVRGPALGLYQMEPATHEDLWNNFIYGTSWGLLTVKRRHQALITDLEYSTLMARLQYYRFPEPMPEAHDMKGMWDFYKKRWNTHLGKTTFAAFEGAWHRYTNPGELLA